AAFSTHSLRGAVFPSDPRPIVGALRPVPQLERANIPRPRLPAIPAVGAAHGGIFFFPLGRRPRVRIHRVDHRPPGVSVFLISRDEQGVLEADRRTRNPVAILATLRDGIQRAEAPAVGVAPPLILWATHFPVEIDKARDDAAI